MARTPAQQTEERTEHTSVAADPEPVHVTPEGEAESSPRASMVAQNPADSVEVKSAVLPTPVPMAPVPPVKRPRARGSRAKRSWLSLVVTLAMTLLAAASLGGWYVTYAQVSKVLETRDAAAQQIAQLLGQDTYTRSLNVFLRETKTEREALAGLLFHPDLLDAIHQLEQTGTHAGSEVSVLSVGGVNQEAGSILAVVPVTIEAAGKFPALLHFVSLLEALPYLTEIAQFRLARAEGGQEWRATIRLDVGEIAERKDPDPRPRAAKMEAE